MTRTPGYVSWEVLKDRNEHPPSLFIHRLNVEFTSGSEWDITNVFGFICVTSLTGQLLKDTQWKAVPTWEHCSTDSNPVSPECEERCALLHPSPESRTVNELQVWSTTVPTAPSVFSPWWRCWWRSNTWFLKEQPGQQQSRSERAAWKRRNKQCLTEHRSWWNTNVKLLTELVSSFALCSGFLWV